MEGLTDVLFSSIMEDDESVNAFLVRNAADMEQLVHGAVFNEISQFSLNMIYANLDS